MKILLRSLIVFSFFFLSETCLNAQSRVDKKVNKGDSTRRDNTAVRNTKARKASPHFGRDLDSSKQKRNTSKKRERDTIYVVPESSKRNRK